MFNIYGEQSGPVVTAFHSLSNSNGAVLSSYGVSSNIIGFLPVIVAPAAVSKNTAPTAVFYLVT